MADFLIAQNKVKKLEGGYSDNQKDLGNWLAVNGTKTGWVKRKDGKFISPFGGQVIFIGTKYGIAAPTLAAYMNSVITAAQMKALDYNTAIKIYKNTYWNTLKADYINNQSVAELLYDALIQHSPGAVAKIVGDSIGVPVNVPLPKEAITVINAADQEEIFNKLKENRIAYYKSLPDFTTFGKGWLNRMNAYVFSGVKKAVEAVKESAATVATAASENPGKAAAITGLAFLTGLWLVSGNKNKKP